MPQTTVDGNTEVGRPELKAPSIFFEVSFTGDMQLEGEFHPSTFVEDARDELKADEVWADLENDYGLGTRAGVMEFLNDQGWWPEGFEINVVMYDLPGEEE